VEGTCEQNEYRRITQQISHHQPRGQRSIEHPVKKWEENMRP